MEACAEVLHLEESGFTLVWSSGSKVSCMGFGVWGLGSLDSLDWWAGCPAMAVLEAVLRLSSCAAASLAECRHPSLSAWLSSDIKQQAEQPAQPHSYSAAPGPASPGAGRRCSARTACR